ncbi:mannosyltransferase [Mycena rebaudengoi]|nr:mannosyltransferase [Mycena rebaudengoi]
MPPTTNYEGLGARLIVVLALLWLTWKLWAFFKPRDQHSMRSVAILVLGDIGRSPRMMYHAESFAENDFFTDVIGYGGSTPIPSLTRLPKVRFRYLPEPPRLLRVFPFVVSAPIKILHQIASLFVVLMKIPKSPEFILVQNPPSIPTLAIVWVAGRIRGSRIIIDWHNLGYSILAMKLGQRHPFVWLSKWFEATFGRTAYAHLFVTKAMRDFLVKEWDLQGIKVVLHDRPPRHFHRSPPQAVHDLFVVKLQSSLSLQKSLQRFLPDCDPPYSTAFTRTSESRNINAPRADLIEPNYAQIKSPVMREDRPALLVSSTSWTPDEDFSILLDALGKYDARAAVSYGKLPKVLVLVTGKGQQRDMYMKQIGELQKKWKWVRCISMWLEAEDYPVLLGAADLGICLHSSSSGLDLPMKVVDMFGCGLPVCALDFPCLDELVKDGTNGLIFKDAYQLAEHMESLLIDFPNCPRLTALRSSLLPKSSRVSPSYEYSPDRWETWDENWARFVRPLILHDVGRNEG